jgi:putative transposase
MPTAPNQLWSPIWHSCPPGPVAYACFITDAFSRMIVGWRVARHMRTTMVLDAIEMACWSRGKTLAGLRCHSDAGSQFTSIRWSERLAEIGDQSLTRLPCDHGCSLAVLATYVYAYRG